MRSVLMYVLCYVLGSLPFGLLLGWVFKRVDVRRAGTGNIGASNVAFVVGPLAGFLVVCLDVLKGLFAVWLARQAFGEASAWPILFSGFLAIVGHDFSLFLKFRGGKGIATLAGVLGALDLRLPFLCLFLWFLIVFGVRYMAGSTMIVTLLLPLLLWLFFREAPYVVFGLANVALALSRHQDNLRRIWTGREPTLSRLRTLFPTRES